MPKTLLIISQVFLPDPASVGQHIGDVAIEMARRGYRVRVVAANRGYENPAIKYAPRETLQGVEIRRLPWSSFGKRWLALRLLGTVIFMLQAFFTALFARNVDGILFSTSPPMIGIVVALAAHLRGIPIAYWVMDLNPDQLIQLGTLNRNGYFARQLQACNQYILRRAAMVVALDRFMAGRLKTRADLDGKLLILPPWPHEDHIEAIRHEDNPFRKQHGLDGKFVVMYSGNHSPSNPLDTLLGAVVALKDEPDIRFLFVGGGLGKRDVEATIQAHNLKNTLSLPYQPFDALRYSLSAADVHVVSLGENMVGIIHPCKIYGAMAVSRPILFFGPKPSHISDLLDTHPFGWHVPHGDVDGATEMIRRLPKYPVEKMQALGNLSGSVLREGLSQKTLCGHFCDELETRLKLRG